LIIAELFFLSKFRSLFNDYTTTFIIFSLVFLLSYSFGNYYYKKLSNYKKYISVSLLLSMFLILFIPWTANYLVKFLFTLLVLSPTGLFLGVFFPLALTKITSKQIYSVYMINSLGVAAGFFLFYLLSSIFGFTYAFLIPVIFYTIIGLFFNKWFS